MTLPLVQSRSAVRLPSTEDVLKCMEFTEPESLKYVREGLEQCFQAAGVSVDAACLNMLANIDQFINISEQFQQRDPWSGELLDERTDFQTFQDQLADQSVAVIADTMEGDIKMDFAISNSSELIRGYTVNGAPVSHEMAEELDRIFNAWLAENAIITQDSTLYQATERGDISWAQGKPVTVSAETITQLINDKREKGLQAFLERKGLLENGFRFSTEQHTYVTPAAQVEQRKEVKQGSEAAGERSIESASSQRAPGG